MKMKLSLAIVSAVLLGASLAQAQSPGARTISRDQAKTVVLAYLQSKGYKTGTAEFALDDNPDEKDLPEFYLFDAYYNTATRLTSVGAYAVDRRSAALWQRVSCEQVVSDSVTQLQEKYRQEMGLVTPSESQASSSPCY